MRAFLAFTLVLGLSLGACDRWPGIREAASAGESAAPEDASATEGLAPGGPEEGPAPEEAEAGDGPAEYYRDLSVFDWYRRGEPLRHGGAEYLPAGDPVTLPLPPDPLGSYQGVTYYVLPSAPPVTAEDTLYVPVFPRYWLPFATSDGRS